MKNFAEWRLLIEKNDVVETVNVTDENGDHILCDNEWVQLKKIVNKEAHVNGYIYSHEKRCNGKIIAILPFRKIEDSIEFLLRDEVTPCWGISKSSISAITGGVEDNDVETTVIHETKEEAGYEITKKELINLGVCKGTKSSDTDYYLFGVDVSNKEQGTADGDGSELEKLATCLWSKNIDSAVDPLIYVLYYKLMQHIQHND